MSENLCIHNSYRIVKVATGKYRIQKFFSGDDVMDSRAFKEPFWVFYHDYPSLDSDHILDVSYDTAEQAADEMALIWEKEVSFINKFPERREYYDKTMKRNVVGVCFKKDIDSYLIDKSSLIMTSILV